MVHNFYVVVWKKKKKVSTYISETSWIVHKRWRNNHNNTFGTIKAVTLVSQLEFWFWFFFSTSEVCSCLYKVYKKKTTPNLHFFAKLRSMIAWHSRHWKRIDDSVTEDATELKSHSLSLLGTSESCYQFKSRNHCKPASILLIFRIFTLHTSTLFCCKISFYKNQENPNSCWRKLRFFFFLKVFQIYVGF